MKTKRLTLLALVLCMSALFLPVTAYAATDTSPPSINAWLEGDIIHAEASDRGTGVEAVYIDGFRIGYLVDGAVEVGIANYSADGEYITVYALDFAGSKSREVKLKNPYYTAPAATSAPTGTMPNPTPTQSGTAQSSSASGSSQSSSASQSASSSGTAASSQTTTESAIPGGSGSNAFTPDGTGSVQDNATEADGKEFFTITTEAGNVFYLIIDRQRDENGVYLLNTVTEDDLMALAEKSGGGSSGESAIPTPEPTPITPEPDPTPDPEPAPQQPAAESNTGTIIFVLIVAIAAGGAGYYFKILRPKQQAGFDSEDEDDQDEYDDYPDDSEEYDFSEDEDYAEFVDDDFEKDEEVGGE